VTCRRGALDLGPNVAVAPSDVCQSGIRLVVKQALEPGEQVSVGLEGQTHTRPTVRVGKVVWCLPTPDGAFWAGVQFEKDLPYALVLEVSREPSAGA
jgi:hypothetical protein